MLKVCISWFELISGFACWFKGSPVTHWNASLFAESSTCQCGLFWEKILRSFVCVCSRCVWSLVRTVSMPLYNWLSQINVFNFDRFVNDWWRFSVWVHGMVSLVPRNTLFTIRSAICWVFPVHLQNITYVQSSDSKRLKTFGSWQKQHPGCECFVP